MAFSVKRLACYQRQDNTAQKQQQYKMEPKCAESYFSRQAGSKSSSLRLKNGPKNTASTTNYCVHRLNRICDFCGWQSHVIVRWRKIQYF